MDSFFAGVSAAASVKLASSVDDVIWLSSFLTPNMTKHERIENILVYAGVCLFQPCLAYIISSCGEAALDTFIEKVFGDVSFTTDKLLTIVGGLILCLYAIMLGIQFSREKLVPDDEHQTYVCTHIRGDNSFDNENPKQILDSITELQNKKCLIPSDDEDYEDYEAESIKSLLQTFHKPKGISNKSKNSDGPCNNEPESDSCSTESLLPLEIEYQCVMSDRRVSSTKKTSRSLVLIAFFGSMDGLTLYIPLLAGKTFGIFELLIGVSISVIIIVTLCLFLTRCSFISNFIQHIPLFAIVSIFATLLLAKGIIMR